MPLNEPFWNNEHSNWMRITSNGRVERLESDIMVPPSRSSAEAVELKNTIRGHEELSSELRNKRWIPVLDDAIAENNFDTHGIQVSKLMEKITDKMTPTARKAWEEENPSVESQLKNLTPFELSDAAYKLNGLPFSEKENYRQHIYNFASSRNDMFFGEDGLYPTEIGNYHVSKLKSLVVGKNGDSVESISDHILSIKHPKAGKLNFYMDAESGWLPFDGLTYDSEGGIVLDNVRSSLLRDVGLSSYMDNIIRELNNTPLDQIPRDEEPIAVTDAETFNENFTDAKHLPTDLTDTTRVNDLLNHLKLNKAQIFDSSLNEISYLKAHPKAAQAVFNNLSNLDKNHVPKLIANMFAHNHLSAGHPDLLTNQDELFTVINNRNERGDPDQSNAYEETGYNRPISTSGAVVPYKAMTKEEGVEFRNHWEDLYDRPKAWMQHTTEGKMLYDGTVQLITEDFDWDKFVTEIYSDFTNVSADGTFVSLPHDLREMSVGEIISSLDEIIELEGQEAASVESPELPMEESLVRDLLSDDEIETIDRIMRNDEARLAFGIDDREEGLKKKFTEDAFNELLGTPVIPTSAAWKAEAEDDTGYINVPGVGRIPTDETYKRRTNDGLIQMRIQHQDSDGAPLDSPVFSMSYDGLDMPIPEAFSGTRKDKNGKYQHIMNLSNYLHESILDQFVRDGVFPTDYASSPDIKVRDTAPTAPEFDSPEMRLRANYISNRMRSYGYFALRGYDNEKGLYQFMLDPDDTKAEMTKKGTSIISDLYKDLNKNKVGIGRKKSDEDFVYPTSDVEEEEIKVGGEGNGKPPERPPVATGGIDDSDSDKNLKRSKLGHQVADALESKAKAQDDSPEGEVIRANLQSDADNARKNAESWSVRITDEDLENDPVFQAYQEELKENRAFEVLANAPLDIRATAYRLRIQGLQDRFEEATTMGEAYDIARDWMRAGTVEYRDMLPIDRDGTSKFKRLRDSLSGAGVDWYEVNQEWVEHGKSEIEHQDHLDVMQEKINFLNERYTDIDAGDEAEPESQAAARLKATFELEQRNLRDNGIPSFGSQAHVDMLNNDPDRAPIYENRNATSIGEPGLVTGTLRGTKNSITRALAAGLTTWRESRLYGMNPLSAGLHAAMSTIGEGTGIGADRIRGMDLSKPLEQMKVGYEESGFSSYISGRRDTLYDRNRKNAASLGIKYPEPESPSAEQLAALGQVQESAGRRVVPTSTPPKITPSTDPNPYTDPPPKPNTPQQNLDEE